VKALPEAVETSALVDALADGWGFIAESAEYAAVGAGSYHWVVQDREGRRGYVTVDDLDAKTWLGDTRETAFNGLCGAFDTAAALRASGLGFVVAPIPTGGGGTVRRLGPRHTIALFPFVDGRAGEYGRYEAGEPEAVVRLLAELHAATPAAGAAVHSVGLELPGRRHIEAGLREVDETWSGGPFSEPARRAFAARASDFAELLALADRLAADVERHGAAWVVTHGEPHSANVMRTDGGLLLLDWDTVAVAPPERDLWMLVDETPDGATVYAGMTGHRVDADAVSYFRLMWDLKDLAERLNVLRSPHGRNDDTAWAYEWIANSASIRDQWAALL
jgi:spectinomycin phosphotransferase